MTSEHIWCTLEMRKYRINGNNIVGGGACWVQVDYLFNFKLCIPKKHTQWMEQKFIHENN